MKKFELTGFQLKLIALAGMIIDHINTHFGSLLGFPVWVSWVGRFVAPVFLFLLMEGFRHTSNRLKYFQRLSIVAFIMLVINLVKNIVTAHYYHPITKAFDGWLLLDGNNIFLTLMCFYIIFWLVERFKTTTDGRLKYLLLLLPLLLVTCLTEGGLYLLPIGLILAWFHNDKKPVIWVLLITSIVLGVKAVVSYYSFGYRYSDLYHFLAFENQFMQCLAVPLILSYNGQRGGSGKRWEKNLFYMIYPVHLTIIYLIDYVITR